MSTNRNWYPQQTGTYLIDEGFRRAFDCLYELRDLVKAVPAPQPVPTIREIRTELQVLGSTPLNLSGLSGILPTSATQGDILIVNAQGAIGSLPDVAVGQVLVSGGVGSAPSWSATPSVTSLTAPNLYGGANANDDITIQGTSHATKTTSYVLLQPTGGSVGVGGTPDSKFHVVGAAGSSSLRIGYNATPVNYYNADTHYFRDSNNANTMTILAGVHVGGTSDPGDNNLLADGTIQAVGAFGCNGKTPASPTGSAVKSLIDTGINTAPHLSYGSMYADESSITVSVAATNTYYRVDSGLSDGGSSAAFTFQNTKELKCIEAGTYMVHYSMSINCATNSQDLSGAVMVNSTAQLNTTSHQFNGSGASKNTVVTGHGIISLVANDLVRLSVANHTAIHDIVVEHANLTIFRVA